MGYMFCALCRPRAVGMSIDEGPIDIIINHKAVEIIHLVATVRLFVITLMLELPKCNL